MKRQYLTTPFQLGKLTLPSNIFYAPLAGCSDYPYRKMSARYKPGLIYCEMVKMDALVRNDQGTFHILDYSTDMHPIGAQLCGSNPKIAGKAAKMLQDLGFDVIDLNCGCPVDKITKDGSGSGLLKNPDLIGEIVANIVAAVDIPVTVKVRAGWGEDSINAPIITEIAEKAGASAICIHGRTRQQAYRGAANWDYIKACKEKAKLIKVIGNGDLFDAQSVHAMFEHTGCDAVLVARGTMGQPWIVEDIMRHLNNLEPIERDLEFYRQALYEHFLCMQDYQSARRVAIDMRRVGCWYFKKSAGTKAFREKMSRADSPEAIRELILNFNPPEANPETEMQELQTCGECSDE
jgi:nifR3 family TIM-barrel protein